MLKNIDPLLNADVLRALRAMGHGDTIVVADTNFPSDSIARQTVLGELLRIDATAARVTDAILSVMPLDSFIDAPARRMEMQHAPDELPPVQQEVQEVLAKHGEGQLGSIERFDFYDMAKQAYCVVTTAEYRPWGCFWLQKGVILPAD